MKPFKKPAWTITGILATSLTIAATLLPLGVATDLNPAIALTQTVEQSTVIQNTPDPAATRTGDISQTTTSTTDTTPGTGGSKTPTATPTSSVRPTGSRRIQSKLTATPKPTSTIKPSSTPTATPTANPTNATQPVSTPTATPTTTTQPSSAPTSIAPTGNQTNWMQTYSQDFTTDTNIGNFGGVYGKNLLGYNNFTDTSKNGTYLPNQVLSTSGGNLDYYIHYTNGKYATAAPMPQGATGQTYGKYSMRFRADNIPGYKTAFLLWPDSGKWSDGEIDFPEAELGGNIYAYSHDTTGNPNHNALAWNTDQNTTDWHTVTIEWAPDHLTYTIDGVSKTTTDKTAIPSKPMHLVLQAETDLNGVKPVTSAAGHIQIDWLTIYKYTS